MKNWKSYQTLGTSLLREKRYQEAINALHKSIELKEHRISYHALGLALIEMRQYQKAISAFNKALAFQEDWTLYKELGTTLHKTNQYQAAINAFNKSLSLKDHWGSYYALGSSFLKVKRFQEAVNAFKKSLEIKEHWHSYQQLGSSLLHTKDYKAAINAFNKSLMLKNHWNSYQGIGLALFNLKQYEKAINAFNQSLKLKCHWSTYNSLGLALFKTCQYQEAADAFKKSLTLKDHWNSYHPLGLALFKIKQYQAAMEALYTLYSAKRYDFLINTFYEILNKSQASSCKKELLEIIFQSTSNNKDGLINIFLKLLSNCTSTIYLNPLVLRMASSILSSHSPTINKHTPLNIPREIDQIRKQSEQEVWASQTRKKVIFGDSHSYLYEESDEFEVVYVGAGTMYNINNPDSSTGHFNKIISTIKRHDPKATSLIFVLGEIDLRNHILKKSRQRSINPMNIADKTIDNCLDFLVQLKGYGFEITISGPHCGGGTVPYLTSSEVERNNLCAYFNDKLALECSKKDIKFCTLYDIAVNQKSLKNISYLYQDHCHLQLPKNRSNLVGIALSKLARERVMTATAHYCQHQPLFYKSEISANCRIVFGNIPDWCDAEFVPGEAREVNKYFLKDHEYFALVELPFGIEIKEVILVFNIDYSPPKTTVRAVNEFLNLSEEVERQNIEKPTVVYKNEDGVHLQAHCFAKQSAESRIFKYILIKTSCDSGGARLRKIGIKRWIPKSLCNSEY